MTGIDLHGFGDPERIVIRRASELIGLEFLLNVTMPTPTFNETNIPNVFVSNDFSTARSDTKIKVMNYQIALLLLPLTLAVSGCAAVAVIETAVDVAATCPSHLPRPSVFVMKACKVRVRNNVAAILNWPMDR